MAELTAQQEKIMARVRVHAQDLAAAISEAGESGVSTAYLLPELVTTLRESGIPVPAGLSAFV